MATERVLSNLNLISFKTEGGLQNHIDELQDGDLVFTPDNSLKGTLLDFKWADHLLNDMSWLRADTFSWHSGDVYVAAYNHLVADFEGTVAETTTIDGIEITFYLADDKHKICLPDQEDKLLELYNKTGVAWYYILDTENKQFKLPRTKFGFTGLRDEVGGYVEAGLPDHTHNVSFYSNFGWNGGSRIGSSDRANDQYLWEFTSTPASENNKIYKDGETVQPPATQMYLYFYVGNFERDAIEQTAGISAEMFNSKADSDLKNIPTNYDYVVESQMPTAETGYTWYRKYKSGWVEMGGITSVNNVTFPVEMADTNYTFFRTNGNGRSGTGANELYTSVSSRTTTGFMIIRENAISPVSWCVYGMSA